MDDFDWQADLRRYPSKPFLKEQSVWAIWVYRYGRRIDQRNGGLVTRIHMRVYWLAFRFFETVLGIGITKSVSIGPGLRIWHFGNIFIHPEVVIGANCTLRQGVTLGNRHVGGGVPTVGDGVEFGAYAQVIGPVHIGNGAKIGAMSVVLTDVPDGATAVGNPARILRAKK